MKFNQNVILGFKSYFNVCLFAILCAGVCHLVMNCFIGIRSFIWKIAFAATTCSTIISLMER